jgi:ParB/RepB/Spo0J family partition protein
MAKQTLLTGLCFMTVLKNVLINQIRENKAALREVDRQSEKYIELVDSVKSRGVLNPIVVREVIDQATGDLVYGLVDGLHRFTAACDAGIKEIPANVVDATEGESLELQIITNLHRVETKPVEFSKGIQRIMMFNPTLTVREMAKKFSMSTQWVNDRLGLLKLHEKLAGLVDEGQINLSNAFALAKLPPEEQLNFTDRAMTDTPQEFVPAVLSRKKELDKARREGRDPAGESFSPQPYAQKIGALKDEYSNPTVGPVLVQKYDVKSAEEGFHMGVAWALHMDPESQSIQLEKERQRLESLKAKREAATVERKKKKAESAQVTAARLEIEAKHADAGTDPTEELAAFDAANKTEE